MPNTNLIVTDGVAGNISSCKTELSIISGAERDSIFYTWNVGYATNNCTGLTDIYKSWSLSGFSVAMILLLSVMAVLTIWKFLFD